MVQFVTWLGEFLGSYILVVLVILEQYWVQSEPQMPHRCKHMAQLPFCGLRWTVSSVARHGYAVTRHNFEGRNRPRFRGKEGTASTESY